MNNQKRALIIMGAPASGKGTQARRLAERLHFFYLESRALIQHFFDTRSKEPAVQEAKLFYDSGRLVPSPTIFKWLTERVQELHAQGRGIVFDGSPRTLYEAERLLPLLASLYGVRNIEAFFLAVTRPTLIDRATKRRVCDRCGVAVPFSESHRPLTRCPVADCGGQLITKSLDTPDLILKRLEVYEAETMPAVEHLRQRGYLTVIDGEPAIEAITVDILSHLKA